MSSSDFRSLKARLATLRRYFLPRTWDPLGVYRPLQQERAVGYTVLAHAELEEYIEKRVIAYADAHLAARRNTGAYGPCLLGLVHVAHKDASKKAPAKTTIDDLLALGYQMLRTRVNDNHGLKRENLEKLMEAVGLDPTALPPALIVGLSSFGHRRGGYAHTSGTQRVINPKDELEAVEQILADLVQFDTLTTP